MALANEAREITVLDQYQGASGNISSLSFMKRQPAEKWRVEETEKFYLALQIFGTDFSMIERVFEGERSREQIKNKFRKEERKNKAHIDKLLANKEGLTLKFFTEKYGPIKFNKKTAKKEEGAPAVVDDDGHESSSLDMVSSSDSSSSDDEDGGSADESSSSTPI